MLRFFAALALGAAAASAQTDAFQAWPCDNALLAAELVPGSGDAHFIECQDDGETVWLHTWAKKAHVARRVNETVAAEVPGRAVEWQSGFTKMLNYIDRDQLRAELDASSPWRRLSRHNGSPRAGEPSIKSLELRNRAGAVTVAVAAVEKPRYKVFGLTGEPLPVSACQAFGPLDGTLFVDCSGAQASLEVEIPAALPVGVETQSGSIAVLGHPAELRIVTASGALELQMDPDQERIEGFFRHRPDALSLSSRVDLQGAKLPPFQRKLVNRPATGCGWVGGDLYHPKFRDDYFLFGSFSQLGDLNPGLIQSPRVDPFLTTELPMGISSRRCEQRDWQGVVRIRAGRPVALRVQNPGPTKN